MGGIPNAYGGDINSSIVVSIDCELDQLNTGIDFIYAIHNDGDVSYTVEWGITSSGAFSDSGLDFLNPGESIVGSFSVDGFPASADIMAEGTGLVIVSGSDMAFCLGPPLPSPSSIAVSIVCEIDPPNNEIDFTYEILNDGGESYTADWFITSSDDLVGSGSEFLNPGDNIVGSFSVDGMMATADIIATGANPSGMVFDSDSDSCVFLPPPLNICTVPESGNMVVDADCFLTENAIAPANVIVQDNSRMTIIGGVTLDIDFVNFSLIVKQGSSVLIEFGGSVT